MSTVVIVHDHARTAASAKRLLKFSTLWRLPARLVDIGMSNSLPAHDDSITSAQVVQAAGETLPAKPAPGDWLHWRRVRAEGLAKVLLSQSGAGDIALLLFIGGEEEMVIALDACEYLPSGAPRCFIAQDHSVGAAGRLLCYGLQLRPCPYDLGFPSPLLHDFIDQTARSMTTAMSDFAKRKPGPPIIAIAAASGVLTCARECGNLFASQGLPAAVYDVDNNGAHALMSVTNAGEPAGILCMAPVETQHDCLVSGLLETIAESGIPCLWIPGRLDARSFDSALMEWPEGTENEPARLDGLCRFLAPISPEASGACALELARVINNSTGPTAVLIPRGGLSECKPPAPDGMAPHAMAVISALETGLDDRIGCVIHEDQIQTQAFAKRAVELLGILIHHRAGFVGRG